MKTKSWYHRIFLAVLAMCETNAYCALKYTTGQEITRFQWLEQLSEAITNNEWLKEEEGWAKDSE